MTAVEKLVTDHLDLWTSAIKRKSAAGRGSSKKIELYGIKKLRELILELAVRGMLLPQDPKDEPASELLKKISAERTKLVKEGRIKKEKPQPPIDEEDKPLQLPNGWEWVRLSDIGYNFGQKIPDDDFTYIDVGSINSKFGLINDPTPLSAKEAPARARKIVKQGSVIYSTVRPYLLNIAIIQETFVPEPIASTAFAVVHPFKGVSSDYLYYYLRSPVFVSYVESVQNGIAYPAINDRQFFSGLLPLPPTSEQQRIGARVDELMALCDQLEQQTEASLKAHQTLVENLLNALINAADYAQFSSAWQRIVVHFDTLFTTEQSIDQLKQTFLQLAVLGKLAPQDPKDEPASELLKKISAEKAKLIKEGKIKKEKPLRPIGDEEKPFELPVGWAWARFPELGDFGRGKSKYRPRNDPKLFNPGIYPLVQTGEVARANNVIHEYHSKYSEFGLAQSRMWPSGTLCITIAANIADSALLGFDACFPDSVVGFIPCKPLDDASYFLAFMKTARENLIKFAPATAQKNINLEILESVLIPIPPKNEISRISSKIDELMALCDQLKARLNDTQTIQLHLADAMAEKALAS